MYKCNKCLGSGKIKIIELPLSELENHPIGVDPDEKVNCTKCLGSGELDWIEYIIGKRKPKYLSCDWNNLWKGFARDSLFEKEIIQKLSKEISLGIDKQIIEELRIKVKEIKAD